MGAYEPDDSRKVTHASHAAPGEPLRTGAREDSGPRENEARRDSQPARQPKPEPMPEPKQRARQSQGRSQCQSQGQTRGESQGQTRGESQGEGMAERSPGQSQAPQVRSEPGSGAAVANRGESGAAASVQPFAPGAPDEQAMQSQPEGPLAGNQPQAIDNLAGTPTPVYDQYEVNQPQNTHQSGADHERLVREQAVRQDDYGGGLGRDGDGGEGMADAPEADVPEADVPEADVPEAEIMDDSADDPEIDARRRAAAEERGHGGHGRAAKEAYDKR